MKNLNLATKIGILVGVLVATALAIAVVGVWELSEVNGHLGRLVEVNGKAIEIASQLRIEVLGAVRAEKNAVISPEDKQSVEFANQSREHTKAASNLRDQLSHIISTDPASPERQQLDEFNRSWEKYQEAQKELLRLAVLNTNPKAAALVNSDIQKNVVVARDFLYGVLDSTEKELASPDTGKDAARQARLSRRLMLAAKLLARTYGVVNRLNAIVYSSDEKEMNRLDGEIAAIVKEMEAELKQLPPTLDDAEKA